MFTGAHSHTHAVIAPLGITFCIIHSYRFLRHVASKSFPRLLALLTLLCASFITIFQDQGAHRANSYTIVADMAARLSDGLVFEGSDHSIEAATGETQDPYAEALPAYPHAPAAENAFVGVVGESQGSSNLQGIDVPAS